MVLKGFKQKSGVIVLVALTLIPLFLWIDMQPLGSRFVSPEQGLKSVSQVSALLGTVLFAFTLILLAGEKPLGHFFTDKAALLGTQRVAKTVSLLLLLAHPIVLALMLLPEGAAQIVQYFFPQGDWVFNFGIYALVLFMALYAIEFLAKQTSSLRHVLPTMSAILFLGTLHAFFIPSDLSRNPLLKTYVLSIVVVAFLLYGHHLFALKRSKNTSVVATQQGTL